ncbi:MAG: bifunctional oligoribonuclease/PAP phosphatase NrnA [Candidatus Omnitrophica bacterium]|nr:bifunctional oligoribonuclease/PAP phosphatase NrnA [Candidatus Omnitrophota bacterium]
MNPNLKKAAACLKKYNSFLITSHTNLEGDALGSELAFYALVKRMGKTAFVVNDDLLPYGYDFLPNKEVVIKFSENKLKKDFDCFVVLDCSDLNRPGRVAQLNTAGKPVLNIDHHISNQMFADVNWVEPGASSCCEMIYKLFKAMRVPIDKETAICLYAGILTDTGSFRYSNTSAFTHSVAADLLARGFNGTDIYRNVYENVPLADMKILSKVLPGMKQEAQGRVIWFQIKRDMLAGKKTSFDLGEQILSFGRAIKGVEVVVLFKENLSGRGEIRVNFRSRGNVDVNSIAQSFGGGGHKTASGATISGTLASARKKVLARIKKSLI